ncbi:MAG: LamG domain-containing protein [Candidatus Pseudobacter hemicellulosilyticus]|uniref:LamG domain-containing protein n=1 Tax=Candidatus Pseudobacter hemicellulosilyticus TaxID=3121375 RepID=A0AAJ5WW71_9BACT|nr:MAG: LamG domain-containing protein [Pseudobacter sp.]
MKLLTLLSSAALGTLLLFSGSVQMTSCTKETRTDTLVVRDTVSLPCNCSARDLVAHYTFTNGSLKDSSGQDNHITFSNATLVADRFGNPNGAFKFNGTNNYMSVPNSPSLNPGYAITLMATVKLDGLYTGACHANQILGKSYGDNVQGYYALRVTDYLDCHVPIDPSKMIFSGDYGDNERYQPSIPPLTSDTMKVKLDKWYTVAFTYANGKGCMYVNGELKKTETGPIEFTANKYDLHIGNSQQEQYPYWFNGVIDEIRIYSSALTAEEVKEISNCGK